MTAKLMKAIEDQLSLRGFEYDCGCPWCEALKPIAVALNEAKEEASQADYRDFCALSQAESKAQESARQVVESGGALAQSHLRGDGRFELRLAGKTIEVFRETWLFEAYCRKHKLRLEFV
jgi:hypothetical protein